MKKKYHIINILLLTNSLLGLFYLLECCYLYLGKYNYDGWRLLPVFFAVDVVYIVCLIFICKDWKFALIIFFCGILQNSAIGFGISNVCIVGLLFCIGINLSLFLLQKKCKYIKL